MTSTANERPPASWDSETDVVVVGGGFAGLVAAATARGRGSEVIVLEAGEEPGGIMKISSGEYWIPNNPFLREAGIEDPRADCLRLMARLSYPTRYDPESPALGLQDRPFRQISTYYDVAAKAVAELKDIGAMGSVLSDGVTPDGVFNPMGHLEYHAELPENKIEYGRALMADTGGTHGPGQGQQTVNLLVSHAGRAGIELRTAHVVQRAFASPSGELVGVEVQTPGGTRAIRARKGVIFTSGGFFHNAALRALLLRGTVWGATAPYTNTGVLMTIAAQFGALVENTDSCWWGQMGIEEVLDTQRSDNLAFWLYGDSMVMVNRYGVRVANEKAHYNERGRIHGVYNASTKQYENNVLFQVYDAATANNPEMGVKYPVPYPGQSTEHVITGDTWAELATNLDTRLAKIAARTGGVKLDERFADRLAATVTRFNSFAASGHDDDFFRGERAAEHGYSVMGLTRGVNRTMYPFASSGPYYAILLGAAGFDTNGGPALNENAQVVGPDDQPIPGFYAAGNAAGSPAHGAYWSGGATLGNALVWAYQAGAHAAGQPDRDDR
ncbi:MAG: FAD-dependent oxidoreductase [Streptosporangiaceae bacterium]